MFNFIASHLKGKSKRFLIGLAVAIHVLIWWIFYLMISEDFWIAGIFFTIVIMGMAGEVHEQAKNANIFFVLAYTSIVMFFLVFFVSLFLVLSAP